MTQEIKLAKEPMMAVDVPARAKESMMAVEVPARAKEPMMAVEVSARAKEPMMAVEVPARAVEVPARAKEPMMAVEVPARAAAELVVKAMQCSTISSRHEAVCVARTTHLYTVKFGCTPDGTASPTGSIAARSIALHQNTRPRLQPFPSAPLVSPLPNATQPSDTRPATRSVVS